MSLINDYPAIKTVQVIARKRKVAVYLVGGFLRDYLLGNPKKDFDFAVERDALKLAKTFAGKIKGAFVLLDEERGCARVAKKSKGVLETYDFADYRAKTLRGDLSHRDFTINTLAIDLSRLTASMDVEDVLEDLKQGRKDINNKKIKMTSVKIFQEDPLRMLRAFSLKAQLDFKIDRETLSQIKKDQVLIREASFERIRDELFKILSTERASENLIAMDKIGLLEKIIPQVAVMYSCKQGTYHHLDVWPHSLETVVQLDRLLREKDGDEDIHDNLEEVLGGARARKALVKLAALLHDIGKPDTRKREKGKLSFHGHEHVGKNIVRIIAKMIKISTKERYALEDMVRWHLRPGYLSDLKQLTERAIYRFFRDAGDETASVLLLSLADQRATRGPLTTERDLKRHEKLCCELLKRYFAKKKEKPLVRLIDGNDLIKGLKLKPSPLFGRILAEVEEKQSLGKIKTKKEALMLARKVANI